MKTAKAFIVIFMLIALATSIVTADLIIKNPNKTPIKLGAIARLPNKISTGNPNEMPTKISAEPKAIVNEKQPSSAMNAKAIDLGENITWDFETGDLQGWTRTGDAFIYQPTYGDNPAARDREPSNHQGNYWIGGYEERHLPTDSPGEIFGDGPQGTLTSDPFKIKLPYLGFLIGGGCNISSERVDLIIDGHVVRNATGRCFESMELVSWNVSEFIGKTAQIKVVDASSDGWGHMNFDDVRFASENVTDKVL